MNSPVRTPPIRRFVVLAVLLALMLGARALSTPTTGPTPLILAAIGFVILTSFSVAETVSAFSLPRVTGYIITGAVLTQTGILSAGVARELQMFNTLALGLIALGAGLELSIASLARVSKTLFATSGVKVILAAPLVGLVAFAYLHFAPRFGLAVPPLPRGGAVGLALVLGALAIGTSPSIALAVISESKSKGRVSDLVLGAAVLKDIVVVVVLAAAIAVASGLLSGGALDASLLVSVGREVTLSILAGVVLGALLIAYIRYINSEMLLFVGAMILSVAEVSRLLHLELLLVFIAGGFVVRNFSSYEHQLSGPVQLVSLPIFVVFFTIAGARIDLAATLPFLPLALGLAIVRALTFRVAAAVGNRAGDEGPLVRRNVWLGYLPQAGVTLGLLGLSVEKLPTLALGLKSAGMAFVAVNLLVGPITLRLALKRAGEVSDGSSTDHAESDSPAPEVRLPPALARPLAQVAALLERDVIAEAVAAGASWAARVRSAQMSLHWALRREAPELPALWEQERAQNQALDAEESGELYLRARAILRTLPPHVEVPERLEDLKPNADDSPLVHRRKRRRRLWLALTFQSAPVRRLPLQRLARQCLEFRMAELSWLLWTGKLRLSAALLEELASAERRGATAPEVEARVSERVQEWEEKVRSESEAALRRGLAELEVLLTQFDTPYLPRSRYSFQDVEEQVRGLVGASGNSDQWVRALDANYNRLVVTRALRLLEEEVTERVRHELSDPAGGAVGRLTETVKGWHDRLAEVVPGDSTPASESSEAFHRTCEAHREHLTDAPRALVEATTAELQQVLDFRPLLVWLEGELARLPETVLLAAQTALPSLVQHPRELTFRLVEVRRAAEARLLKSAVTYLELGVQAFEQGFRDRCGALLRAQDDFRAALRSGGTEAERRLEVAKAAVTDLLAAYRECWEGLEQETQRMRSSESATVREAMAALDATVLLQGNIAGPQTQREYFLSLVRLARARVLRFAGLALATSRRWWQKSGGRLFGSVVDELSSRAGGQLIDAESLRGTMLTLAGSEEGEYTRHFRLEPVRDPARFVAQRQLLDELVEMEARWMRGGVGSLLVVGEHGSGRTSLLNMLQYRARAPRVIRLEPLEWRRQVGVIRALAYSLGSSPKLEALKAALASRPTQVLIDDLEQWLRPGEASLRDLVRMLDLVCATRREVFWTVTVNRDFFELASQAIELNTAFGKLAELEPLSRAELREVIEARHRESGRALELPRTFTSWFRWKALSSGDSELVFELIRRSSGGNLSRALMLWTLLAKVQDDDCVRFQASRAPLAVSLPFLRNLEGEQLAFLTLLNYLGPLSVRELGEQLRIEAAQLERIVTFFETSGLIVRPRGAALVALAPSVTALVSQGLKGVVAA